MEHNFHYSIIQVCDEVKGKEAAHRCKDLSANPAALLILEE
jgi:hypothetical protein